jgi:hypothetical protein
MMRRRMSLSPPARGAPMNSRVFFLVLSPLLKQKSESKHYTLNDPKVTPPTENCKAKEVRTEAKEQTH